MLTEQERADFTRLLVSELEKYNLYGTVLLREGGENEGIFIWVLLDEEISKRHSHSVMKASLLRHFLKRNVHLPFTLRYAQIKWQKERKETLGGFLPIKRMNDQIIFDIELSNLILQGIRDELVRIYQHYGIKGQPKEIKIHWLS